MSIKAAKWIFFVPLCFKNNLLLASDFFQLSGLVCLELLPFLIHCSFCIWNFNRLLHWNKCVNHIIMRHRSVSFAGNMIFVMFDLTRFRSWSRGLMGFHYTGPFEMHTQQFPEAGVSQVNLFFARHGWFHRYFQLSPCIFEAPCILHHSDQ